MIVRPAREIEGLVARCLKEKKPSEQLLQDQPVRLKRVMSLCVLHFQKTFSWWLGEEANKIRAMPNGGKLV